MILLEEVNHKKGTYAAVNFDTNTKKALHKYIQDNHIPNQVRPYEMHATILYSTTYCPNYVPVTRYHTPIIAKPSGLEVWNTAVGKRPVTRCLVLTLDCPDLMDRHRHLMTMHNASYAHPSYRPHITLSYDIEDLDVNQLSDIRKAISEIVIVGETGGDMNPNWIPRTK